MNRPKGHSNAPPYMGRKERRKMKQMKKVMALLLALAMVMGMSTSVFAASIEVKEVIDGEEYTAYKILNYKDNDKTGDDRAVSYYLTNAEYTTLGSVLTAAGFHFTKSSDGTQWYVDNAKTLDAASVAAYLATHTDDLGDALGKYEATGANKKATFTNLDTGYYFVTSTAGSLCALHEDSDIETVVEKNTIPTGDKSQSATENGTYADTTLDLNIGDTVYYKYVITNGKGSDQEIVFTDTMSDSLDLNQDAITVVDKDGTALPTTAYSLTKNAHGFVLTLTAAYVKTMSEGDKVTVQYSATLNEEAQINKSEGNSNTGKLEYSNQESEETIYVETYDFQLFKTDGSAFLNGAGFKLYDAATGGNQIKVAKDDSGYYVDADADADEEIMVEDATGVNVRGLAAGTYYLEETTVPEGYNKLAGRTEVTIAKGQEEAFKVTVVNQKGTELPSTGGIGTTIFYILGAGLVIGAVVMLVARKKAEKKAE